MPSIVGKWPVNFRNRQTAKCGVIDGSGVLYLANEAKTLAQITTQLNDSAICIVSKVSSLRHMGFGSHRPTTIPLLNAHHRAARLALTRYHRDRSAEGWKRVAWRDEF
ncbi:hypothetical protein TNCV_4926981 [Trichonephila clavipes]|nr:hypothetical protein TNCV_4926981 [Trichonephila clavipes]